MKPRLKRPYVFRIMIVIVELISLVSIRDVRERHRTEKANYDNHFAMLHGPVDQLEDRYLGMVEAASSNLARSTFFYFSEMPI
jgi:hypothetical protein